MDDYGILGLSPGAGQKEIKSAYFKLVRKFSPENNPERFQEIRCAYERLTQKESKEKAATELKLEMPDDPAAQQTLEKIQMLIKQGKSGIASDIARNAIDIYGGYEAFLYELACSQQLAGHTTGAIKSYAELVERYPDKSIYKRGLAFAYYDRGYGKKAYAAFEDAYAAGIRDTDFILQFSLSCCDRMKYKKGIAILSEMVEGYDNADKDNIQDYIEACLGMYSMDVYTGHSCYSKITELYLGFLKKAGRHIKKYNEAVLDNTYLVVMSMPGFEYIPAVNGLLEETEKLFPKRKYPDGWEEIELMFSRTRIKYDGRLGEELNWCYEAFIEAEEAVDEYDDVIIRFMQLDCELVIIERLEEIKPQFEIIKNEYPGLYAKMESFIKSLEKEDILYIKDKLLEPYDRMEKLINGGHYYELYPQNRRDTEKLQWDSMENGSFVRKGKKVGRNDPCPCGSGKKYKQCCGKSGK